jgi:hypothetical protein
MLHTPPVCDPAALCTGFQHNCLNTHFQQTVNRLLCSRSAQQQLGFIQSGQYHITFRQDASESFPRLLNTPQLETDVGIKTDTDAMPPCHIHSSLQSLQAASA